MNKMRPIIDQKTSKVIRIYLKPFFIVKSRPVQIDYFCYQNKKLNLVLQNRID